MAKDPKFNNIQNSFSDYLDAMNNVTERINNLTAAKTQALNEGNSKLANEIEQYLKRAEGEKNVIQKILDVLQMMAKGKGEALIYQTTSEKKEQDRLRREFEKEQEKKANKMNDFWNRFGYDYSSNQGNIERSSFGEGFGSTKKVKEVGDALSMFGGRIGKVGGVLTRFAGRIGIAIEAVKLLDKAIGAIADAYAKQQDIQNRRNTMLTDRNIELSNIETEGNVDILNTFKDNMLSEYNKLFTELQGQVAIANAKAIASTNAQIEGTIGDINNAAWNALAAQTDIWAQQQKLGLQVAKTKDIENRAIAQRDIELGGRQSERVYQSRQSILKAQRTNAELNMEEQNYTYEHPWATTANKMVGGSTEADHVRGDNKWNAQYDSSTDKYLSNGTKGSAMLGATNDITLGLLKNTLRSGITVQQTKTKRDLTNASNDLNAAQAENTNRVKMQNTVIANSNEIKNKVLEGMTEIKSSVIDTQAAIDKAYQKMAQAVEKWFMDWQDKIYDSGILKGMTDRGQLDKYRSSMLPIMEEVSRKYGVTKEEFVKMQNDYTADGRSKLLNREDLNQQASLGKIYLGGDFGTAAELANNTEIFNMGVSDTVDLMGEMSKQVNKIGLDGRKYLKDMVKNLKMAQKYDFRGGVKGMMKMAKWAQNTRFNMDNLPNMLEDIQKGGLEGIITKAAKLQVLGGRFAMGADPIAMAFEAYNNPAALAKRFNSMTMGMGHFNKETGEVEFNGMEMDQMRALAEYTDQSIDDVKKQARYNVKKDKVEGFIKDNTLSQEQRMDLVNKAYYQDGQWKVNDVTGNAVNLSDVNSSNIKDIQADTYEGKMEQGMEQIVSFTKLFTGNIDANMAHLSDSINKNGAADNELRERLLAEQKYFFAKSQEYSETILEKMQEATAVYKNFLNGFVDPANAEKEVLKEIKSFSKNTHEQLNLILKQMGGAAADIANKNELAEKLKGLSFGVNTRGGKRKNVSAQELVMNGSLYMGGNGQMYINQNKIRETYGSTGKLMYGDYTRQQLKQRGINEKTYGRLRYTGVGGTTDYATSVKRQNEQIKALNYKRKKAAEGKIVDDGDGKTMYVPSQNPNPKYESLVSDGVMNGNGNSMFTQASKVTPINDGKVQIAKSDPKDTAVFAKNGGPFDTLFNDVFGRINDVYNKVSSNVMPTEPLGKDAAFAEAPASDTQASKVTPINDGKVQMDPVNITINGKLELSGGNGQSIDIMSEIKNNPMLLRSISDMIVQNISTKYYGGRPVGNSNFRK